MRYLVTAALPYANGPLHIGHLSGAYLPADIYARYLRLRGHEVLFICGSDEHGVAITFRALAEKTTPQAIIDRYHPLLENSLRGVGISLDYYGRTSDPLHHTFAQKVFLRLMEGGYLEAREVEQFYDPVAKAFLPDRYIVGTCPHCGFAEAYGDQCEKCSALLSPTDLLNPRSRLSQAVPERRGSTQYFFRLDLLVPALRAFVESRSWKPNVGPVIEGWLRQGLAPRAITRDLDWGIPVPSMPGKVLYVWFEAPLGYISITQKWAHEKGSPNAWLPFWKEPDTRIVHFIGKDNIVFHTLIFPAMLIAADEGYTLPYAVPANEFLNLEGQKISTSRRWTIDLNDYLEKAPHRIDELRFVLTALMPQTKDRDFTWQEYEQRIHTELLANLSNLIHRLLSLLWRQGQQHAVRPAPHLLAARADTAREMARLLEEYDFSGALESLLSLARLANKELTETSPWHQPPEKAYEILLGFTDLLLALGTLMEPFMPVRIAPSLRALVGAPLYAWEALEKPEPLSSELIMTQAPQPLVPKLTPQEISALRGLLPATPLPASGPAQPSASSQVPTLAIEDFQKVRLKVVTILQAERIPKADKLLKLRILSDDGEHTVVSGVAAFYTPETLVGKQAIWVSNLPRKTLRGVESEGMLLFAEDTGGQLVLVSPVERCAPGSPVK